MNFITFPVSSTNIFPLANSTAGGQLLSEWNIRSRETVGTHSNVKYDIGLSFAHSYDDFKIICTDDGQGISLGSSEIMISEGKALVNGHFVQSLAPVVIDLNEANAELELRQQDPLKGRLAIGLRAMYSTEYTMAGAMTVEDSGNMYTGVQVVILPESDMVLPKDSGNNQYAVNCHLKLGRFDFINGRIGNLVVDSEKVRYVDAERIANIEDLLSSNYISKSGLYPRKLYVFSGKSSVTELDTWCDGTDSLIIWDKNYSMHLTSIPPSEEAKFLTVADDEHVKLVLPHKQVDGMTDGNGNAQYYADKVIDLPVADYAKNTPGTVSPSYTKQIKTLSQKLSNIYQYAKGKQVGYKEILTDVKELPPITSAMNVGDYVLVKEDSTVEMGTDAAYSPSTLYAVIPGYVVVDETLSGVSYYGSVDDSEKLPKGLTGVEIEEIDVDAIPVEEATVSGESLARTGLVNYPISEDKIRLVLSGSMTYQVTNSNLFDDDNNLTNSFTISAVPSNAIFNKLKTKIYSENDAFKSYYGSYTTQNTGWETHSLTLKRIPKNTTVADGEDPYYSWEECGIQVGDVFIIVFDTTTNINSGVVTSTTLQLTANTDFNPINGQITNDAVIQAIEYTSPKALYKYWKVTDPDLFPDLPSFRGEAGRDYFVATYKYDVTDPDDPNKKISHYTKYYFRVENTTPNEWSGAIRITGQTYLATESTVGGFYNVPNSNDYSDAGYVYLDDNGNLRLKDYSLLRAGTLAYQLGEDIEEFGNGEDLSLVQETLDEAINDRIAFPSIAQYGTSTTPNVINITINLTDAEADTSDSSDTGVRNIYIRNIDSRFGTAVYFHFTGTATSKTVINFVDCAKIRIDSNICGNIMSDSYTDGPIINLYRCGLYYDPAVMNYIASCKRDYTTDFASYDLGNGEFYANYYPTWFTGMKDIKLWYQAYETTDPQLTVDDMTVSEIDVSLETEDIDYWTLTAPNDNHYHVALSSLTFAGDGTIIKCGLLVASSSTENVKLDDSIMLCKFKLPQGAGLSYPNACLTRQLKITGTFTSAYRTATGWYVSETSFTALTQRYNRYLSELSIEGSIALHENTKIISADVGTTEITPWLHDTFNLFYGGVFCADQ